MAAAAIVDPDPWRECFEGAFARLAERFKRVEPRRAAHDYLLALLSDVDTRSCWQLAEQAGHASPHRMQRLLAEAVWDADTIPPSDEATGQHWLLIRRRIRDGELAFYRCWPPQPVALATLVRVAGARWCVEECFRAGKDEVGLDQHQVHKWTSWYRYTTLAMFAHAILAAIAARAR